jgi:hypothetical protein
LPIVALAEVPRSLEDVYLSIVSDQHIDRGAWTATQEPRTEDREPVEEQRTKNKEQNAEKRERAPAGSTENHETQDNSPARPLTRSTTHPFDHSPVRPLTEDEEVRR